MKLCFYCDSIFTFGGVQRVVAIISKALSKEHDITILTLDDSSIEDLSMYDFHNSNVKFAYIEYPKLPFYEYFPCKFYSFLYKKALKQNKFTSHLYGHSSFPNTHRKLLIQKLNEGNHDIIIGVHAFKSLNLASIKKKIKSKVVGWMHTSYDAFFNNPGLYLWEQKNQFRYEIPNLDALVVLTQNDSRLYKENMNIDTTVIYNPLSFTPEKPGSPDYKKFLAVGRMSRLTKGFDILIEAFALFAKQDNEWTLDIVGEGPEEELLRRLISKYKLEKRIVIHPFTKDIQKHYSASSVFILSSRWEGFGLVMAEAMAHHLPIIASDIPVVKELLGNKENTFIFKNEDINDLANKMYAVARMENLNELGNESYQISQIFHIENIIKQWDTLLHKVTHNTL